MGGTLSNESIMKQQCNRGNLKNTSITNTFHRWSLSQKKRACLFTTGKYVCARVHPKIWWALLTFPTYDCNERLEKRPGYDYFTQKHRILKGGRGDTQGEL